MKVALAQINSFLGDFEYNKNLIIENIKKSEAQNCDIVVFPEASLFGYHPFDLLERKELVKQQLNKIKLISKEIPNDVLVIFGAFTVNPSKTGKKFFNSAVVLQKNKKPKFYNKTLLPTGDVFDEARFIESGDINKNILIFRKKKILLTICEDIWAWPDKNGYSIYSKNPLNKISEKKLDLVINLSASPFYPNKLNRRLELIKKTSHRFKCPMVYCNLVGAQDEIIFDGQSMAVNNKGDLILKLKEFSEDLGIVDFNKPPKKISISKLTQLEKTKEIYAALVLGIKDFCLKTGLSKIHLGLSGGIDSAVVAALAVKAIGCDNVLGVAMPGPFSDKISQELAKELADNLNIEYKVLSIENSYELIKQQGNSVLGIKDFGLVHENLQARLRGMTLMMIANQRNSLLLSTSNKSEYATGYSTLYGDMCGGLAPIGDLLKHQVYNLAEFINLEKEIIPKLVITRPPTAELRPNQKDQDTLPAYDILDASVDSIVTYGNAIKNTVDEWVFNAMKKSEFKRWQAPPILKVSEHSFGRGRRFPVSNKAKELL